MNDWTRGTRLKKARRLLQAINGRPLATFCGGYLAGATAGIAFHPLSVMPACLLALAVGGLLRHYRLLSAGAFLLLCAGVWLGAVQGIRYTRQDALLWRTLPDRDAVIATGEVITEPTLKWGVWCFIFRTDSLSTPQGVIRTPVQIWVSLPETRLPTVFCGDRLELEGRLQTPSSLAGGENDSFVQYLRRQGVSRTLRPYRVQSLPSDSWRVPLSHLRRTLIRNLRAHLPTREGSIAAAIVLNERTGLDNAIRQSFRRTGTVHILSPSGTHVSMLALAIWALCRCLKLPRRASALTVITVIWLFVGVAGGGEPALRAAVMGTLVAGAVALQRELDMPTSLALAGFLLVLADTGTLRDPSFQFSFLLVAAIVASSGWLRAMALGGANQPARLFREALGILRLSVVCAVASAPLTALYYGQMSLIAPIANLVIALPVQVVTGGGLLVACLPQVPELATAPIALNAWLVDKSVRLLAVLPGASVATPPPSRAFLMGFYALLFAALLVLSARASRQRTAVSP